MAGFHLTPEDKLLTFDLETTENTVKYSAFIAALATAGFGYLLSNFDRLVSSSWLSTHPRLSRAGFVEISLIFLFAIAVSAAIHSISNRKSASYKSEKSLVLQRELSVTNHPKVFSADAEVRLVLTGTPTEFIPDLIFEDLAKRKGGALIDMGYDINTNGMEIPKAETNRKRTHEEEQTERSFELLAKQSRAIANKLCEIDAARSRDEKTIAILLILQQVFVGLAYISLCVVAFR